MGTATITGDSLATAFIKLGRAVTDPEGSALTADVSTLVIGPEGGFTHQEMDLMPKRVSLPGGILRAETAAVAAGVMLTYLRSQHG